MIINRNRKDLSPVERAISNKATVYLNGRKVKFCIEASVAGPFRKGLGYVIRQSSKGKRKYYGLPVEKVYGLVEIRLG